MSEPTKSNNGLTPQDISRLRKKLLAMRAEILGSVSELEEEALRGSDEVSVDHMADHGSDNFEQEQSLHLMERQSGTLKEIQAALKRIEEGTYGICEATGKPIGKARLSAIPYARLCLEAQMEQEGA